MLSFRNLHQAAHGDSKRQLLSKSIRLFSQFLISPRSVGSVVPSSRLLAKRMVQPINFSNPVTIVELGPGTGAITAAIGARLKPPSRYVGLELNTKFFQDMSRRFPNLAFVNGDAVQLDRILQQQNFGPVDAILSSLPWASLPSGSQPAILAAAAKSLRPGGVFVTYAYLPGLLLPAAHSLRRQLSSFFSKVETTPVIWTNLPPAFTYVCHR